MTRPAEVIAAYAGSANMTRARMFAPSMLRVGYPSIRPFEAAATPPNDPNLMVSLGDAILLEMGERVTVEAESSSGTAETAVAMLWLRIGGHDPVPPGDAFTLRYDGTMPATSLEWVSTTPDITDGELPAGTYAVVGLEFVSTTAVAARIQIPGTTYRGGAIAQANAGDRTNRIFYDGSLGTLGSFQSFAPPSLEVFKTGSETSYECYLRLVRTGEAVTGDPTFAAMGGLGAPPTSGMGRVAAPQQAAGPMSREVVSREAAATGRTRAGRLGARSDQLERIVSREAARRNRTRRG
ncbi:MAG: hypothetical protein ACQEXJ_24890 [Myxococcota bacterium]